MSVMYRILQPGSVNLNEIRMKALRTEVRRQAREVVSDGVNPAEEHIVESIGHSQDLVNPRDSTVLN